MVLNYVTKQLLLVLFLSFGIFRFFLCLGYPSDSFVVRAGFLVNSHSPRKFNP